MPPPPPSAERLLPCPFCEQDDVGLTFGHTDNADWIMCANCDAEGPCKPSKAEAIAAWNTRQPTGAKPCQ